MTDHVNTHTEKDYHGHPNYLAVYISLVVLLGVSLAVGNLGMPNLAVILIFGTAVIKSALVIAYFMHLKYEPLLIKFVPIVGFVCLLILYALVFPDIILVKLVHSV